MGRGKPFPSRQDLARLRRAFTRPSSVIVHEQFWTSSARHADVVLPATMSFERDDYAAGRNDPTFFPMHALTRPAGEARDDYAIFAALAEYLGQAEEFTEGRSTLEWLRYLYEGWQARLRDKGFKIVDFDTFWNSEKMEIPIIDQNQALLSDSDKTPKSIHSKRQVGRSKSIPRPSRLRLFGLPRPPRMDRA
ncbi:molybdopterin-dependent oxidoreductase (plasmid) [Arthrobacter sp. NyZ413]